MLGTLGTWPPPLNIEAARLISDMCNPVEHDILCGRVTSRERCRAGKQTRSQSRPVRYGMPTLKATNGLQCQLLPGSLEPVFTSELEYLPVGERAGFIYGKENSLLLPEKKQPLTCRDLIWQG